MNFDKFFNLLGATVTLAMVTVIVSSPNVANQAKAIGNAWAGVLRAASGR